MADKFNFGSNVYPGLAKLAEECGENLQVIGKLIATGGESAHWDGTDLRVRLLEELADLSAATDFAVQHNFTMEERCDWFDRKHLKLKLFIKWHEEGLNVPVA